MKLTAEQIESISNYVASFDIKWYELQVEFTDHIVSSAEEFFTDGTELNPLQLRDFAAKEFRQNGFIFIEEERTQILKKEYGRKQLKMVGEFLKFPKIIASALAVFVIYKSSFYFEDIAIYFRFLFSILLLFSAFGIYNWYRFKKIKGKRFLALDTAYKMNNSAILISFYTIVYTKEFQQNIDVNHYKFIPFCCLWVLCLLMIITGRHLTNQVVSNIKKQYQFT